MLAAPILDPVRWSQAFNAIPDGYKWVVIIAATLIFGIRYWKKNGGNKA